MAFTEVKWKVLTPNTMEAYLEDLEAGEASVSAYYGLTTQGYENLSNNIDSGSKTLPQPVQIHREILSRNRSGRGVAFTKSSPFYGKLWQITANYGKLRQTTASRLDVIFVSH